MAGEFGAVDPSVSGGRRLAEAGRGNGSEEEFQRLGVDVVCYPVVSKATAMLVPDSVGVFAVKGAVKDAVVGGGAEMVLFVGEVPDSFFGSFRDCGRVIARGAAADKALFGGMLHDCHMFKICKLDWLEGFGEGVVLKDVLKAHFNPPYNAKIVMQFQAAADTWS